MTRPEEFFHGTSQDIPMGEHVVPANEAGHAASENYYKRLESSGGWTTQRRERVFMADKPEESWNWAEKAAQTLGGRPRVYKVQPDEPPQGSGIVVGSAGAAHYTTNRAKVEDVEWTPPPGHWPSTIGTGFWYHSVHGGVQGTLPPLNWRQHYDSEKGIEQVRAKGDVEHQRLAAEKQTGRLDLLRAAGRLDTGRTHQRFPGMQPATDPGAVEQLRKVGAEKRDYRAWHKETFGRSPGQYA